MTSAAEILKKTDRELFPKVEDIHATFRKLAAIWHPDRNRDPLAGQAFAHISEQKVKAEGRGTRPTVDFPRANGMFLRMEYLRQTDANGVKVYSGQTRIAYFVPDALKRQAHSATVHKWRYLNDSMKKEMERFLPERVRLETSNDGNLFIFPRNADQILMSDLIALDKVPPDHVTWMISRLVNICCYLEWAGVSHCGISPENLLVSLDQHTIALAGPPLFLTKFGERPNSVPQRTLNANQWLKEKSTKAGPRIDLALVRETAFDLLGERSAGRLRGNPDIKPSIINWILTPPGKTAVADYQSWEIARGDRRFAHYGKSVRDIYDRI